MIFEDFRYVFFALLEELEAQQTKSPRKVSQKGNVSSSIANLFLCSKCTTEDVTQRECVYLKFIEKMWQMNIGLYQIKCMKHLLVSVCSCLFHFCLIPSLPPFNSISVYFCLILSLAPFNSISIYSTVTYLPSLSFLSL